MTKTALSAISCMTIMSAALIVGCNSTPSLNDPDVKKSLQAQKESIQKDEAEANAVLKKSARGKTKGAQIKSIKGRLGGDATEQ